MFSSWLRGKYEKFPAGTPGWLSRRASALGPGRDPGSHPGIPTNFFFKQALHPVWGLNSWAQDKESCAPPVELAQHPSIIASPTLLLRREIVPYCPGSSDSLSSLQSEWDLEILVSCPTVSCTIIRVTVYLRRCSAEQVGLWGLGGIASRNES